MVRSISFACCFFFLVCHAIAREIPNSQKIENQTETKTLVVENNKKDLPKNNDEVNKDNKNFIKFGGIGAAGGIGGVAGIVPIDYLGKGLGAGIMPMPMMPLPGGGGLGGIGGGTGGGIGGGTGGGIGGGGGGGAGGIGGGGGGPGCPTPISKGGLVTTHP